MLGRAGMEVNTWVWRVSFHVHVGVCIAESSRFRQRFAFASTHIRQRTTAKADFPLAQQRNSHANVGIGDLRSILPVRAGTEIANFRAILRDVPEKAAGFLCW